MPYRKGSSKNKDNFFCISSFCAKATKITSDRSVDSSPDRHRSRKHKSSSKKDVRTRSRERRDRRSHSRDDKKSSKRSRHRSRSRGDKDSKRRKSRDKSSDKTSDSTFTKVISKIAPKVGIDVNDIHEIIKAPAAKQKLSEISDKYRPAEKPLPSNLIPISTSTAQVLAARAAAIAAAQNINSQIMNPEGFRYESEFKRKSDAEIAAEKEAEQKRLEEEMRKRRERIEKWRNEKRAKEAPAESAPVPLVAVAAHSAAAESEPGEKTRSWNLEDEDDEEDEPKPANVIVEDEEDPLDAFMKDINTKALTSRTIKKQVDKETGKKVTIMVGVAKATSKGEKNKGLIMEQDIDGLEYDSEQEDAYGIDDLTSESLNAKNKTKSEMVSTDHSKVYYRAFRKNFYVEVPELSEMSGEQVEEYREELEGIKIKGKNCPKPIKVWAQCGVSLKVSECLKRHGFDKPTPIQAQAVPIIMSGRDMIGIAKTGSGKTLAFLLPMFRHVLDQPPLEVDDGPIAVVMTPTRELAMQIAKECRKFTRHLGLNVVAVYGGSSISEQIAELKRGTEIIVCTPGRMIDMLAANNGRVTNLRRVTYVVLDEADRMFDMGFEPQVNKILENVRPDRQTVMFSATFPKKMEDLARKALHKPIEVSVGGRSVVCKEVEQHVVVIDEHKKYLKLLELLGLFQPKGSVIVFVDKQEDADDLCKNLLKNSYSCMALHGGVDQDDRESIMDFFKKASVPLLVATSIAARGLDVKDLILVVNYDCPNHYEDYVHRCGRTGRAGNHGYAYTFLNPEQKRYAGHVIKALEVSGAAVSDELRQMWNEYAAEMEAAGKKVRACTGGFEGKGFKFNEQEEAFSDERKKLQKVAFGLHVDSDEEDADVALDEQIEDLFKSKRSTKDKLEMAAQPAAVNVAQTGAAAAAVAAANIMAQACLADKLKNAKGSAEKIALSRKDNVDQLARSILGGASLAQTITSKTVAEQIAEKLNMRLNYIKQDNQSDQDSDAFKVYEEELEINDFPQQARWRITSKETISHICEYAEVGITVRGSYFAPTKEPPFGERKLYLAIESGNEKGLSLAKSEIARIIKEEISKMSNPTVQLMKQSRYKIV
ncbi:putative ATP-dependent RNA helicase DDX46 [Brachionus plicatilis]|uniref:Probable ATP-dependent RNA helicase DDX46 n=1 Tax=Brachionus plicatilis TaxID=10195 RepID=A0A3M7RSJ5_BRAPC|nr:putative ATP-dependent RNA helicase DDX46 [Brachionus plicatilis]